MELKETEKRSQLFKTLSGRKNANNNTDKTEENIKNKITLIEIFFSIIYLKKLVF